MRLWLHVQIFNGALTTRKKNKSSYFKRDSRSKDVSYAATFYTLECFLLQKRSLESPTKRLGHRRPGCVCGFVCFLQNYMCSDGDKSQITFGVRALSGSLPTAVTEAVSGTQKKLETEPTGDL